MTTTTTATPNHQPHQPSYQSMMMGGSVEESTQLIPTTTTTTTTTGTSHNNIQSSSSSRQPHSSWSPTRRFFGLVVSVVTLVTLSSLVVLHAQQQDGGCEWCQSIQELGIRGHFAQAKITSEFAALAKPYEETIEEDEDDNDNDANNNNNNNNNNNDNEDPNAPPLLGMSLNKFAAKQEQKEQDTDHHHQRIPEGCEATVMLIRHCEKGHLKSHCNYAGYERSMYLATQFGGDDKKKTTAKWPIPSTPMFALKTQRKHHHRNYREVETVQALADEYDLEIDESYHTRDNSALARRILTTVLSGQACGKLILVSWKHSDIPKLARKLGCGPMQGCPFDYRGKQFDEVWQIKYVYRSFIHNTRKTSKKLKQWSMYGTAQMEQFDPLAFSKSVGDYPTGGTDTAGRWAAHKNFQFYA